MWVFVIWHLRIQTFLAWQHLMKNLSLPWSSVSCLVLACAVAPAACEDPLAWWQDLKNQFPYCAFLAKQILGIPGSRFETEQIFSIAGVLTSLRRCRLQNENLDCLVYDSKNWPNDPRIHYYANSGLKDFMVAEASLAEDNDDMLEEARYFEELVGMLEIRLTLSSICVGYFITYLQTYYLIYPALSVLCIFYFFGCYFIQFCG